MTKEELKQEAEESFEQYKVTDEDYVVSPYSDDMGEKMLMYNDEYYAEETYLRLYKQGYLAGAEPREKRIAELKAQIEKMKCCENCGWYYLQQHWRESKEINESRMFHCGTCGNKKNWKLRR